LKTWHDSLFNEEFSRLDGFPGEVEKYVQGGGWVDRDCGLEVLDGGAG